MKKLSYVSKTFMLVRILPFSIIVVFIPKCPKVTRTRAVYFLWCYTCMYYFKPIMVSRSRSACHLLTSIAHELRKQLVVHFRPCDNYISFTNTKDSEKFTRT
jgi:hypothetical protein